MKTNSVRYATSVGSGSGRRSPGVLFILVAALAALAVCGGCGAHTPEETESVAPSHPATSDVAVVHAALAAPQDYATLVKSDGPASYWRLGENAGRRYQATQQRTPPSSSRRLRT